jgi:hypothetical protein
VSKTKGAAKTGAPGNNRKNTGPLHSENKEEF